MDVLRHPQLYGLDHNSFDPEHLLYRASAWWALKVPAANRAQARKKHLIEYARILAVDELGDHYNEGPHLLVDYIDGQPFSRKLRWLESVNDDDPHAEKRVLWSPKDENRIKFFPRPLPDLTEEYREHI